MNNKALAAIALTVIIAVPIGLGYLLNLEENDKLIWEAGAPVNITDKINNTYGSVYTSYDGPLNNYYVNTGGDDFQPNFKTVSQKYTSIPVYGTGATQHIEPTSSVWLGQYGGNTYTVKGDTHAGKFITLQNVDPSAPTRAINIPQISGYAYGVILIKEGTTVTIDNISYPDVSDVQISAGTYDIVAEVITGFADPAGGWSVTPYAVSYWTNHQQYNAGAKFMLALPANSFLDFSPTGSSHLSITSDSNQNITYTFLRYNQEAISGNLGKYAYLMLDWSNSDGFTLAGIAKWPAMGKNPTVLNSYTYSIEESGRFTGMYWYQFRTNDANVLFRVDSALIGSSQYPIAADSTIEPAKINPAIQSYQVQLSKVERYGLAITFGGETLTVKDNSVIVGTKRIQLNNAVLSSVSEDGITWINKINDREVSQTLAPTNITLNGTWSAIYTLSPLQSKTIHVQEWAPGTFAIDMQTFGMIGAGTAAAAFIALGMTGKASGSKMLILGLVCGMAAVIFGILM